MTKKEIKRALEICLCDSVDGVYKSCEDCPLFNKSGDCSKELCDETLKQILKENEPAPAGTDTSSNHKNTTTLDDTAKLEICQEKLLKIWGRNTDVLGHCIDICDMIHSVSEMIRTVLDVLNDLEKLGDNNAN